MTKAKHAEEAMARPFAATLIGWLGLGLSVAGAVACVALAVLGAKRGRDGGDLLLYGLLFLPVSLLGLAMFRDFLRLKDWVVAPEVPLGVKLLGHVGRVVGTLAMAACVALCVLAIVCPGSVPPLPVKPAGDAAAAAARDVPRPLLVAIYVLGIFISMLVRTVGSAILSCARGRGRGRWSSLALPWPCSPWLSSSTSPSGRWPRLAWPSRSSWALRS